jgi:hypothetical protein
LDKSDVQQNGCLDAIIFKHKPEKQETIKTLKSNFKKGSFTLKNTAPYNPATNFKGGQIVVKTIGDEMNSGIVKIERNSIFYTITVNPATTQGALVANFEGTLEKI